MLLWLVAPTLDPPDALQVLRLLQEAFNNALKQARASGVRFVVWQIRASIEIRIDDDDHDFDPANALGGRGLRSQRRRAEMLPGAAAFQLESGGRGTSFVLRLPVVRTPRADGAGQSTG